MMGQLKHDQEQLFYSFRLDEAVPHEHPIRKIDCGSRFIVGSF